MDYSKLWEILKEMRVPDHLTCLMRNLCARQEATVKNEHGKWTGSKLGKEYVKTIYCHLAYLTYIQSTLRKKKKKRGLDKSQNGIQIAQKNINNIRNANDITLMAESEEELKSLLMKVKGE